MRRFVALAILTLAIFLIGAWNLQSTSPAATTANPGKAYFAGGVSGAWNSPSRRLRECYL
jgi:hypothetical protein